LCAKSSVRSNMSINIVLIGHGYHTTEPSDKRQVGHVRHWYSDISGFSNESTIFNIALARKCLLVPTKTIFHTNKYFMIFCYQSFILKILVFIKMNLSCHEIPRKRKEKLKYLVLFNMEYLSPACTHTTCKYSLP
jgi:hypothetical protein